MNGIHKQHTLTKIRHIIGNTYTTTIGYTDIGFYVTGNSVILIDTGSEESPALLSFFENGCLSPAAIINTHLHIDHVGCNKSLCERYGCPVYSSADEIRHESLDAIANPDDGYLDIFGSSFRIIPLHGHSIGHQAVVTPDGVCFLGDAVMSVKKLNSFKMPYHLNIGEALDSMERIADLDYHYFVLAHSGIYDRETIDEIVKANLQKEKKLRSSLLEISSREVKDENLATLFMNRLGISREKQDISWVTDTALSRVRELDK